MKFFVGHEFSLPGQPIVLMQQRIQAATWRNQAVATDGNELAATNWRDEPTATNPIQDTTLQDGGFEA